MSTLKATVKGGRLVIDTPTNLPEGTVVELEMFEPQSEDPFAEMDEEERAALNASLDRGLAQAKAGMGRPIEEFLDEL
jgi:hypothetical protein